MSSKHATTEEIRKVYAMMRQFSLTYYKTDMESRFDEWLTAHDNALLERAAQIALDNESDSDIPDGCGPVVAAAIRDLKDKEASGEQ